MPKSTRFERTLRCAILRGSFAMAAIAIAACARPGASQRVKPPNTELVHEAVVSNAEAATQEAVDDTSRALPAMDAPAPAERPSESESESDLR